MLCQAMSTCTSTAVSQQGITAPPGHAVVAMPGNMAHQGQRRTVSSLEPKLYAGDGERAMFLKVSFSSHYFHSL